MRPSAPGLLDERFNVNEIEPRLIQLREGLLASSKSRDTNLSEVLWEIVDDILKNGPPMSAWDVIPIASRFLGSRRQRSNLRKVVEIVLTGLLDPTRQYEMTLDDLYRACSEARISQTPSQAKQHYIQIMGRLQRGPIKEYCVNCGLTEYLNYKFDKVDAYFKWARAKGLLG